MTTTPKGRLAWLALLSIAAVLATMAGPGSAAHAAYTVPYTDPQSVGFIVLYDKAGNAVKGGNVKDHPFAWKAVASQKALVPYDGNGRQATLYLYTPHEGRPSTQWSGDNVTAGTGYPDPAHPTTEASTKDYSLQDYLDEFPPKWDGLVQLRMFLGIPGMPVLTTRYSTTDIKVSGQTWSVVGGGPGAGPGGANIPGTGGAAGAAGAAGAGGSGTGGGAGSVDSNPLAAILPDIGTPGSLVIAALAVIGLVLVGFLWRRRNQSRLQKLGEREAEEEEESLPV